MRTARHIWRRLTICRKEGHTFGTFADKNWRHYRACHRCNRGPLESGR